VARHDLGIARQVLAIIKEQSIAIVGPKCNLGCKDLLIGTHLLYIILSTPRGIIEG
jgi:hypothetical protein